MAENLTQHPGTTEANPSSIHEEDMIAVERIETTGNSTINLIIVNSSLTTIEKRFTDHDEPLFGPKTICQLQYNAILR
jgi:hypothetical protein